MKYYEPVPSSLLFHIKKYAVVIQHHDCSAPLINRIQGGVTNIFKWLLYGKDI